MPKDKPKNPTQATTGGVGYGPMPSKYTPFEDTRNYKRPDELAEDIIEIIDLTGASSWDDARRGWENWQKSDDTLPDFWDAVDMISAIPAVGSYLSAFKGAKPAFNIAKSTKSSKNFKDWVNIIQKTAEVADTSGEMASHIPEKEDNIPIMPSGYFDEAIIDARKQLAPIQETTRVPYMPSPVYKLKIYN